MKENKAITKKKENDSLDLLDGERTLPIDVATEMSRGYDMVMDIINKLSSDTRVEEIMDDDGKIIGQRTHIHPQLIKWIEEARKMWLDIWKTGGGEIQQEVEKKKIEVKAKILMAMIGKSSEEERQEAFEKWKHSQKK